MTEAVALLKEAELYEAAAEMYKLLLPLLERNLLYAQLAAVHGDLTEIYNFILEAVRYSPSDPVLIGV